MPTSLADAQAAFYARNGYIGTMSDAQYAYYANNGGGSTRILTLGVSDPVPVGTPAGTVIIRPTS